MRSKEYKFVKFEKKCISMHSFLGFTFRFYILIDNPFAYGARLIPRIPL